MASQKIDNRLNLLIKKKQTPAVQYLIFDKDKIIHKYQNGLADIKNQKKVVDQTTFHAFSVTKTFTALAILQLVQNGKINLDDQVTQYLDNFQYSDNITVRQLLTHSAGIPNPNPLSWIHLRCEHSSFNRVGFFRTIFRAKNKVKFRPNEKFAYSNLGYVLLGELIEKVSEQTYENYIRDHILQPLILKPEQLDFNVIKRDLIAKGYQKRFSLMNGLLGFFIDKSKFMGTAEGKWKPFKNYYINGASYGGLIGNADGFRKYIQELLKPNCLLISEKYKWLLFEENLTNSKRPTGMCLSWFRGRLNGQDYYAHAGGGGGYYCEIRIYPGQEIGSVIFFNRSGMKDERYLDKLDQYYIK